MGYLNFKNIELNIEKAIKSKDKDQIMKELLHGWKADVFRIKKEVEENVQDYTDGNLKNIDSEAKEDYIYYNKLFKILDDFEKKENKKSSQKTR